MRLSLIAGKFRRLTLLGLTVALALVSLLTISNVYAAPVSGRPLKAETWSFATNPPTLVSSSRPLTVNPSHLRLIHHSSNACLTPGAYATDVVNNGTYLSYRLNMYIENDCSLSTQPGKWSYQLIIDCKGERFAEGGTSGGIPALSPGQLVNVVDQVPYQSVCVYADFTEGPPDQVIVNAFANAKLINGTYVTGFTVNYVYP